MHLAAAETQHQVKGGLLLDVVVRQSAAILELLAREDEAWQRERSAGDQPRVLRLATARSTARLRGLG